MAAGDHPLGEIKSKRVSVAGLIKFVQRSAVTTSIIHNKSLPVDAGFQQVKIGTKGKILFSSYTVPIGFLRILFHDNNLILKDNFFGNHATNVAAMSEDIPDDRR